MTNCTNCGFHKTQSRGSYLVDNKMCYRRKCTNCNKNFYSFEQQEYQSDEIVTLDESSQVYLRSDDWIKKKLKAKKFVVASAQSNTDVNAEFFGALLKYCKHNKAELFIIPTRYKNPNVLSVNETHEYPEEIKEYLVENNFKLHEKLKVLAHLKISSTAEHPLTGLAPLSKGDSMIVGHNQLQLSTLPVQPCDDPIIMTTTGTISEKNYSLSKQGYKAEFNHSMSAVVVEIDGDLFHIRHLNFDGDGFYDFENYYSPDCVKKVFSPIDVIVTGDEHVMFMDEHVRDATYGEGGIVDTLLPKYIVRHDIIDCYSISHHHKHNTFVKFKKYQNGQNILRDELDEVVDFVVETTPKNSISLIISSNHNDHLARWLNECDIKTEPWNAILYHELMYKMLYNISENDSRIPNPFQLYSKLKFENRNCHVEFVGRKESYKIHDIELALHGDVGINGARGSAQNFAQLPTKSISGHSHSPMIFKGVYKTGTSSILDLEYVNSPSSWMQSHVIVYKNGKRQLIHIINGRWRA